MLAFVLTTIGFAGAMSIPVFLTAIAESAASMIQPPSLRSHRHLDRALRLLDDDQLASSRSVA